MITAPEIDRYLARLAPTQDEVLHAMEVEAARTGFPIIGPLVGRLVHLLTRAIGGRRVFEMGSGFGYSTLWFAHAVGDRGEVVHTDTDAALSHAARRWLGRAALAERVVFHVGDAREVLAHVDPPFDVVFLDLEKEHYPEALELARPRVRPGGLILADNVLWHGLVAEQPTDAATRAMQEYNRRAYAAPDLETAIVPLRDGVGIHLKRAVPARH